MRTLLFVLLLFTTHAYSQHDITLFDAEGNATHYINDNGAIYSFKGEPVAYLSAASGYFNVYSYKGAHLGWYEDGAIYDHKGEVVGFREGAVTNVLTKLEPLKQLEKLEPMRPLEKMEPMKPMYSMRFSATSMSYFFYKAPESISSASVSPYNTPQYVPTITPFRPNFELLANVMSTLQQRHDQLMAEGYYYDSETDAYYPLKPGRPLNRAVSTH